MFNRRVTRYAAHVSSASMSDVAFLLLIFFLVTTIFALERGIPMLLPADGPPKKVERDDLVIIRVQPDNTYTVGNQRVSLGEIRRFVERKRVENEKLVVAIESHPDSEYGRMVDVLDELRLARVTRVTLREARTSSEARGERVSGRLEETCVAPIDGHVAQR